MVQCRPCLGSGLASVLECDLFADPYRGVHNSSGIDEWSPRIVGMLVGNKQRLYAFWGNLNVVPGRCLRIRRIVRFSFS